MRAAPTIVIDDAGATGIVRGHVVDPQPGRFAVAVVINVLDTFWTKPFYSNPLSAVNAADGTWSCNIFTGGADACFQQVLVYCVPRDLNPVPLARGEGFPPAGLESAALAETSAVKSSPTVIRFSGYEWNLKDTGDCQWDPGLNFWSKDLVTVETNGLHLKCAEIRGQLRCAEVSTISSTNRPLGLGTFKIVLASTVGELSALDPAYVTSGFTFSPSAPDTAYDEADIWEYSKSAVVGADKPFQNVVQPYQDPSRRFRFLINDTYVTTAHSVTVNRVRGATNRYKFSFTTTDSITSRELASWQFQENRSTSLASDLALHLNIWAYGTPTKPGEIVIKSFQWSPLPAQIEGVPAADGLHLLVTCDSPVLSWQIQESADLKSWSRLAEVRAGEGQDASFIVSTSSGPRFYRAVTP
ncbi:MAG TPA: hypothetical protein VGR78_08305 [Verrucomicrobiae bacterium]|nr:hypothetical protein [Verrucomicrobiae bacterium]